MEGLKVVLSFVEAMLWPGVFLAAILLFREPLRALLLTISSGIGSAKRMSLKLGGIQVESDILRKAEDRMEEIAKEKDIKKRLEMAKQPLLAEEAIRKLTNNDIEWLKKLYEERLDNALFLKYGRDDNNISFKTFERLAKIGLVDALPSYYLDDCGWITPKGIDVLKKLNVTSPPAEMRGVMAEQGAPTDPETATRLPVG